MLGRWALQRLEKWKRRWIESMWGCSNSIKMCNTTVAQTRESLRHKIIVIIIYQKPLVWCQAYVWSSWGTFYVLLPTTLLISWPFVNSHPSGSCIKWSVQSKHTKNPSRYSRFNFISGGIEICYWDSCSFITFQVLKELKSTHRRINVKADASSTMWKKLPVIEMKEWHL